MMALVQSLKEFNKLSAIPFGISSNSIEQHSEFAKNHNLSINLLADPDNSVIKTYTGTSKIGTVSSRQSFLIDPQGILRKIYNPVNAFSHAEEVLSDLKTLTEVIDQLGLLKRRQREMQDSINAASRIQNALLPNLKSILPINFGISLFYKPLEKIGGDCFWSKFNNDNKYWLGLFDCTGHGVPGAFITMVLLSGIQRIETQNHKITPVVLLKMIDEYLLEIFQTEEDKFASSGAEGAIVCFDNDKKSISFAGAKRPLWIQDKNGNMSEIKSQRRILGQIPKIDAWEEKEISIDNISRIFLFSDGITDEGNIESFSFGKERLEELLSSNIKTTIDSIPNIISRSLKKWRDGAQQRDDQTLITLELP